jgi:hypothetical protein
MLQQALELLRTKLDRKEVKTDKEQSIINNKEVLSSSRIKSFQDNGINSNRDLEENIDKKKEEKAHEKVQENKETTEKKIITKEKEKTEINIFEDNKEEDMLLPKVII